MSIPESAWDEAVAAIGDASSVALTCHLGPDGDALGSTLAMSMALRSLGKETVASWGSDPFVIPRHYRFLPGLELCTPPETFPEKPGLLLCFDTGAIERLGTLAPNAQRAGTVIVVDHHAAGEPFGHINLVDTSAAASAVVAAELIGRLGVALDRDMAACLYTGLVTDTGSFKYRNTTPSVHRLAAELLTHDIGHDDIVREVYDTHPFGYLKLSATALERCAIDPRAGDGAGMVWTWITLEDLAAHEIEAEDTEGLIDLVRTADAADVACVLKAQPGGGWKASLRSKGGTNVGAVAETFGGGGHAFAAGFTAPAGAPEDLAVAVSERLAGARTAAAR